MRIVSFQRFVLAGLGVALAAVVGGCGGDTDSAADGIRVVSPEHAAEVFASQPTDMVVLDVRTAGEFAEGHLEGAIMIDFYEADFKDRVAELDRDVPYLLYCRSGNRSGSAREIMQDLGFSDVQDIDGGIGAWVGAGHPVVQ